MAVPILVDADWLESQLGASDLKVFDCTTHLRPDPEATYRVEPGEAEYLQAHIPGAGFLDLQGDFSDPASRLRFTLPSAEAFAEAAGKAGISNQDHVVLYSTTNPMWATRLWWMFRTFGHDDVSVLDGGLGEWKSRGKPLASGKEGYPQASFSAEPRPGRVADKTRVLDASADGSVCVLNSLSREQFSGSGTHYGRPGRIAGSENLPWAELLDEKGCFLPPEKLENKFASTSALKADQVITYCGGGIAATMDLFALALLGHESRVVLYDNSLSEWARDDSLPMETD